MDATTAQLAAMRLAPVQMASWGHPMTTGLSTIDMYLSGEAFEPPDGDGHYRERLVRLPGFGAFYRPTGVVPARADVSLRAAGDGVSLLVCAGTPYKYQPQHDGVLVEIALRLPRAKFVFFVDAAARASQALRERLDAAFTRAGLDPAACLVLLPRQTPPAFFDIMSRSDLFLDPIGFSGFNTAMQAIECGLPIVAFAGRFMRGRLASGILTQMGLAELVADDVAGYVERVVRVCTDATYRAGVRMQIERARASLYDDERPVRALEVLLAHAVLDSLPRRSERGLL